MGKKDTSIANKIIFYIILSSLFIAVIGTAISLNRDLENYKNDIQKRFIEIEKTMLLPLASSFYSEDPDQIENGMNGIFNAPDIVYVELRDPDESEIAYKKGTAQQENSISKEIKVIYKEPDDDEAEPEHIADLKITASLAGATEKIKKQIIVFALIQGSQFILITILIFYIFTRMVSKPLAKMASYAEGIDLNNLSEGLLELGRKKQNKQDELDKVANSFNKMKVNLKHSHEKLKDYAENLENIVDERTKELQQERNNVTKLLHNMSQAVFKVNEDGEILGPISEFTTVVFGQDVLGKNIFDVLYKDIDTKSIAFSELKSFFTVTFGADEIQWVIGGGLMPEVLGIKIDGTKKILHSLHDPLYDEDELVEYILYVVEDITEKVKQEEELSRKDERLKIMEESIEFGPRKELTQLMALNFSLIMDSLKVLEKLKKSNEIKEKVDFLSYIFGKLHTIKGSSGSLKIIRDEVHIVEDKVQKARENPKGIDQSFVKALDQDLHKIHGTLFKYVKVMNEQLKIQVNFDSEILSGIKEKYQTLEKMKEKYLNIEKTEERKSWLSYIDYLENEFSNYSKLCLAINEESIFDKINAILKKIEQNKEAGILENQEIKTSISEEAIGIKKTLIALLNGIKHYGEKIATSMEEGIPVANISCVKKEIIKLQKSGHLNESHIEEIFSKINNESIFSLIKSFDKTIKEVSDDLGKKVSLDVKGEDILIDAKKARDLKGILAHIVRNTLDHGIELPDERKKRGKNELGLLTMTCYKGNKDLPSFKIDIEDDGNGIDSKKLYEKAIQNGAIEKGEMAEEEKINLIFLPSLSTKEGVTQLSGRGVGMDAIKELINNMGGKIEVSSTFSKGTKFRILIPE